MPGDDHVAAKLLNLFTIAGRHEVSMFPYLIEEMQP